MEIAQEGNTRALQRKKLVLCTPGKEKFGRLGVYFDFSTH